MVSLEYENRCCCCLSFQSREKSIKKWNVRNIILTKKEIQKRGREQEVHCTGDVREEKESLETGAKTGRYK